MFYCAINEMRQLLKKRNNMIEKQGLERKGSNAASRGRVL
jgi:hypothetical protein